MTNSTVDSTGPTTDYRQMLAPGIAVTRPSYLKCADVDERTATRDLVGAADIGLLDARGERRGRHYLAGERLRAIRDELRGRRTPLVDPYPTLSAEIRRAR
jgi:hypothetical protein